MKERVYAITVDVVVQNDLHDEHNLQELRRIVDDSTVDRLCYHPGVVCTSLSSRRSSEHEIG